MKRTIMIISLFLIFRGIALAQFDSVHTITTDFERIEIIRLASGKDILEGLYEAIDRLEIKNAIFLSGIGSVERYCYHVVSSRELPPLNEMTEAVAAMDITSMQGYILEGRVHCHITFADENSVVGGHLEPGTRTLTFAIITMGVLPDKLKLHLLDTYKEKN